MDDSVAFCAMAAGRREDFWPAIEKKYGEKIEYWIKGVQNLGDVKYPEQIAFLRENYGFSQAHANAVVMHVRGSHSSRRHDSLESYLKTITPEQRRTVKAIVEAIQKKRPSLELVIAWNQPMFKYKGEYVFGLSAAKSHLLIAPFNPDVIAQFADRLSDYTVLKKTIRIPSDWKVNSSLLNDMVGACIKSLAK